LFFRIKEKWGSVQGRAQYVWVRKVTKSGAPKGVVRRMREGVTRCEGKKRRRGKSFDVISLKAILPVRFYLKASKGGKNGGKKESTGGFHFTNWKERSTILNRRIAR